MVSCICKVDEKGRKEEAVYLIHPESLKWHVQNLSQVLQRSLTAVNISGRRREWDTIMRALVDILEISSVYIQHKAFCLGRVWAFALLHDTG